MKTAFGEKEVALMQRDLEVLRPPALTYADLDKIPDAVSVAPAALSTGMALRFRLRGGETMEVFLNPVIARHLVACVLQFGQAGGWMDAKGDITFPPFPKSDA